MVTVGSEVNRSPQIPLTQQSPQLLLNQHSAPRMVVAKPLIQSHPSKPHSELVGVACSLRLTLSPADFAQLATQLPKLTPQMILASMKSLQAKQRCTQPKVIHHLLVASRHCIYTHYHLLAC